jgi:hypothetical protein
MRVPWESCMRIAVGSLLIALFSIVTDRHRVRYEDPQCIAKSMAKSVSGTRSRSARTPIPPLPPSHRSVERLHIDWLRESSLGMSAAVHVVGYKPDEVLVAVRDDGLARFCDRLFAWPIGLSSGPVAVESGAGSGDPVAQALPGIGEVAMPAEWCRSVLIWAVGADPVQVQRGEFPD